MANLGLSQPVSLTAGSGVKRAWETRKGMSPPGMAAVRCCAPVPLGGTGTPVRRESDVGGFADPSFRLRPALPLDGWMDTAGATT